MTEVAVEKIFISELAEIVDRRPNTVRGWCRSGRLPKHLRPAREAGKGWRWWTPEQVEQIREWMSANRMLPGAGLLNYDPSPDEVDASLVRLRERRSV